MAFEASKINDAVASEQSIFSKQNHDYNIYNCFSCRGEHVRKLTYISGSRCTWRQKLKSLKCKLSAEFGGWYIRIFGLKTPCMHMY